MIGYNSNMIGKTFNRLTVLAVTERKRKNAPRYLCRCRCGKELAVDRHRILSGQTKSCGCLKLELLAARATKHGMSRTPEFKTWAEAKQRCTNPSIKNWHNYGGRGIAMCERWTASFKAFFDDMGPRPSAAHSLDRINVNGNYEPTNCRWATEEVQQSNRRNSTIVEYQGHKLTVTALALLIGAPQSTMQRYIKSYGLSPTESVSRYLSRR
jgi:hypothetical protein